MTNKFSYTVEVNHRFYTGYGKTYAEAKADANRQALLVAWGQKPFKG